MPMCVDNTPPRLNNSVFGLAFENVECKAMPTLGTDLYSRLKDVQNHNWFS